MIHGVKFLHRHLLTWSVNVKGKCIGHTCNWGALRNSQTGREKSSEEQSGGEFHIEYKLVVVVKEQFLSSLFLYKNL